MGVTAGGGVGCSDVGDGGGVSSAQHINSTAPFGQQEKEKMSLFLYVTWNIVDDSSNLPGMNNVYGR